MASFVSTIFDRALGAEPAGEGAIGGDPNEAETGRCVIDLTALYDQWGGPVTKIVGIVFDDTNAQRFRAYYKVFGVRGESQGIAESYQEFFARLVRERIPEQFKPYQSGHNGWTEIENGRTGRGNSRIDFDIGTIVSGAGGEEGENVVVAFHLNDHPGNPRSHAAQFLTNQEDPGQVVKAEKAVMKYGNSPHILSGPMFIGRNAQTIMMYCTRAGTVAGAEYSYAMGVRVTDRERGNSAYYESDIIIDPKIKNDG